MDSGCSSTIVMGRLVKKLGREKDSLMQWNTQAGNITTNLKPPLSAKNIVMWNFHVDESTKGG